MSKKINADDIDEKSLLASIYAKKNPGKAQLLNVYLPQTEQTETKDETESTKVKETSKKRKKETEDYQSVFLQKKGLKTRQCVYISLEAHEKIQKILKSIADQDITVGGYIDTILWQHFDANKEEINELYRKYKEQDDHIL